MEKSGSYRVNEPKVVSETLEGETIVINLETGSYFSLNASASAVWNLLSQDCTQGAMLAGLCQRFDVTEAVAEPALESFLAQLVESRLVVAAHSPGREGAPAAEMAARLPFAAPAMEQYDDMQEMLLADPIHDVSLAGWPHMPPA